MQQLNTKRFFTGERTISNYHLKKQGRDILKNRQGYLTTGPMNLKKPTKTSKAKDHLSAPKMGLKDWFSGDILEHEGETIKKNSAESHQQFIRKVC